MGGAFHQRGETLRRLFSRVDSSIILMSDTAAVSTDGRSRARSPTSFRNAPLLSLPGERKCNCNREYRSDMEVLSSMKCTY